MKRYLSILKKAESLFKDSDPSIRYQIKQIEVQTISCLALMGYPIDFDSMAHFQEYTVSIQDLKNALGERFSDIYSLNRKRQELMGQHSYRPNYETIEESMNRILSSDFSSTSSSHPSLYSSDFDQDKKNSVNELNVNPREIVNPASKTKPADKSITQNRKKESKRSENMNEGNDEIKGEKEKRKEKTEIIKETNKIIEEDKIDEEIVEEIDEKADENTEEGTKESKEEKIDEKTDEKTDEETEEIDEEIEEIDEETEEIDEEIEELDEETDEFEADAHENDNQMESISISKAVLPVKQTKESTNESVQSEEIDAGHKDQNHSAEKANKKGKSEVAISTDDSTAENKEENQMTEAETNRINEQNVLALSNIYGVSQYEPVEVAETDLVYGKDYVGIPPVNKKDISDTEEMDQSVSESQESNQAKKEKSSDNTDQFAPEDPSRFRQFLHKNDLTFIYDLVTVTLGNRKEEAELIIYPLGKEGEDIIVWCLFDGKTIVKHSGEKKHVLVPLLNSRLLVFGEFVDGNFKATIKLPKKDQARGDKLIVSEDVRNGKEGHIAVYDDDRHIEVHVFPTTFKNNQTQNADYFYYVKTDEETITGDTNDNPFVFIQTGQAKFEVVARWDENDQIWVCVDDSL